jgi:hypothetical protein
MLIGEDECTYKARINQKSIVRNKLIPPLPPEYLPSVSKPASQIQFVQP